MSRERPGNLRPSHVVASLQQFSRNILLNSAPGRVDDSHLLEFGEIGAEALQPLVRLALVESPQACCRESQLVRAKLIPEARDFFLDRPLDLAEAGVADTFEPAECATVCLGGLALRASFRTRLALSS